MRTLSGRALSQHPRELAALLTLFRQESVVRYLEIGARDGDTFHAIVTALPAGSNGVAVDLAGGPWGRADSRSNLDRAVADLRRRGYDASAIYGPSTADATVSLAARRGPYDAVLIDADHRYDAVCRDWELYGPMARLVVFHDIAGAALHDKRSALPVEVPRLWAELAPTHRHVELVAPGSRFGLGVIFQEAVGAR